MQLSFRDKKLQKICEDKKKINKEFGEQSKKISQRLAEFSAAESLQDIKNLPAPRLHPLQGDYAECFAVDIKHPFRIIIKPLNGDINDFKTITHIQIIKILDYH